MLWSSFSVAAIAFAGACSDSGDSNETASSNGGSDGGTSSTNGNGANGNGVNGSGSSGNGANGSGSNSSGNNGSGNSGSGNSGSGNNGASGGTDAGMTCMTSGEAGLDPSVLPECPSCMGEAAHCLPRSVVEQIQPQQIDQLVECDETDVCVPDVFIETLGEYDPPDCESIGGGAGRCLSVCIRQISELGTFLPQANCPDGELCAPCVDPRTGEATGACDLICDTGPTEPEVVFERCCGDDSGICVTPDLLDDQQLSALRQGDCGEGSLCAPERLAEASYIPPTCTSVAGAEGRCLSDCIGLVDELGELLPQDTCGAGELCAPCTDPRTGEETAACKLNGDEPTEDPVVFDTECCGDTGLCVPGSAVPDRFSGLLSTDNCASEGADWVCAPKLKLDDLDAPFDGCTAGTDTPGACIPQCIADKFIADDADTSDWFDQDTCDAGWTCAPCADPDSDMPTGACE